MELICAHTTQMAKHTPTLKLPNLQVTQDVCPSDRREEATATDPSLDPVT